MSVTAKAFALPGSSNRAVILENGNASGKPTRNTHSNTRLSRRQSRKYVRATAANPRTHPQSVIVAVHPTLASRFHLSERARPSKATNTQTGHVKRKSPVHLLRNVVPNAPATKEDARNVSLLADRFPDCRTKSGTTAARTLAPPRISSDARYQSQSQASVGKSNAYSGSIDNKVAARS